jgi:hypothetical protein
MLSRQWDLNISGNSFHTIPPFLFLKNLAPITDLGLKVAVVVEYGFINLVFVLFATSVLIL